MFPVKACVQQNDSKHSTETYSNEEEGLMQNKRCLHAFMIEELFLEQMVKNTRRLADLPSGDTEASGNYYDEHLFILSSHEKRDFEFFFVHELEH